MEFHLSNEIYLRQRKKQHLNVRKCLPSSHKLLQSLTNSNLTLARDFHDRNKDSLIFSELVKI